MKYVAGPYTQGQLLKEIHEIEIALTNRFLRDGAITDPAEQRSWRERVEDVSFGRNTVMYDDQGNPSVMVHVPVFLNQDVLAGSGEDAHLAFIVNGAYKSGIYISKYQNITTGSGATLRALSLKHVDPRTSITFDDALLACKQKGAGWHLMTNAEWAALALRCKSRGFMPRGNNNYGKDHSVASEKGIPGYFSSNKPARILTGSGPLTWSDDGSPFGIFDLNGNVTEWVGGLRLMDGEIQVLANNNAADNTKDQSAASSEWKAILAADGSLVAPGTEGTLKIDNTTPGDETTTSHDVGGDPQLNTVVNNPMYIPGGQVDYGYSSTTFDALTVADGVTVHNIAKLLAIAPIDTNHGGDYYYIRNYGERLPYRGGYWDNSSTAGVFCLFLSVGRSHSGIGRGFRSAFVI